MALSNEHNIISERIHDADSETNEKMAHWLHWFMMRKIAKEDIEAVFFAAYKDNETIKFPWEDDTDDK